MDILYAILMVWLIVFIGFWLWFYVTLWPEITEGAKHEEEMEKRRKASDEEHKRILEQEEKRRQERDEESIRLNAERERQREEAKELAKETYKKARSSKDDKEHSHPTEHDESDDLEMVKAIKEKE